MICNTLELACDMNTNFSSDIKWCEVDYHNSNHLQAYFYYKNPCYIEEKGWLFLGNTNTLKWVNNCFMIRKQSQVILFQFSPISYINKQHYHSEKIERFTKRLSEGQEYKKENIYVPRQQKFDIWKVKKKSDDEQQHEPTWTQPWKLKSTFMSSHLVEKTKFGQSNVFITTNALYWWESSSSYNWFLLSWKFFLGKNIQATEWENFKLNHLRMFFTKFQPFKTWVGIKKIISFQGNFR